MGLRRMKNLSKRALAILLSLLLALSAAISMAAVADDANDNEYFEPGCDEVEEFDLGGLDGDDWNGLEEEIPEAQPLMPPDWTIEAELEGENVTDPALAANALDENSTWANLGNEINSEDTVELDKSYIAGEGDTRLLKTTTRTTLDLNGYTIDRNLKSEQLDGGVIAVCGGEYSQLTIIDSGSNGKITGGNTNGAGGGVKLDNMTNLGSGYLT